MCDRSWKAVQVRKLLATNFYKCEACFNFTQIIYQDTYNVQPTNKLSSKLKTPLVPVNWESTALMNIKKILVH